MSLLTLPSEIIFSILDDITKLEAFNLSLTNKRLAQLAQPRLFRYPSLKKPTTTVKYCMLVASRPELALAVRFFSFGFKKEATLPTSVSLWKLLSQSLSCMSNITSLYFTGVLSDIIFRGITLPRLKLFSSPDYFHPEVIQFLSRHPTVTEMYLGFFVDDIPDVPQEFLPSLEFFMGGPFVAEKLVPGRPIRELALTWKDPIPEERMSDIIESFSWSSIPILRLSGVTFYSEDTRISFLTAVAEHLPGLQTIYLNSATYAHDLDQSFFESLTSLLPSFYDLRRLQVPLYVHDDPDDSPSAQLHEIRLSAEWEELCPELAYIKFPSGNLYVYDTLTSAWICIENLPSESEVLLPHPF